MGIEDMRKSNSSAKTPVGSKTDWARLETMLDADIEKAAEADVDNPPMDNDTWAKAVSVPAKSYIHIGLDEDVLGWFKTQGRGYQTRINAVLRRYVEAQRKVG